MMKLMTLDNGLRVFFYPQPQLRSATVGVWVAAGSSNETAQTNGISHFIEHIVFKGTRSRSAFEIAQGMDRIGAQVNAYTTKEYTFFYTRALSHRILQAADILFDMVQNPKLDEKDIDTERGVILEEIAMCEDDPADVCYELNERSIFAGAPLAFEILGTKENVSSFQTADFDAHRGRYYVPERMVIGVGGCFDETKMREKIERFFGGMKNARHPLGTTALPFHRGIYLLKKEFEQTHLMLTFPGVGLRHDDLYVLQVLMFMLGTGSSSQLNQRIREELGLVYSIDAWLGRFLSGGYIAVSMSLSPASQETALRETLKIICALSKTLNEAALSAAKEKLTASLIMHREQPHSKLSSLGHDLLMHGSVTEDDEIICAIQAVTLEKVKAAAQNYLRTEAAALTAVGKVEAEDFYEKILQEAGA